MGDVPNEGDKEHGVWEDPFETGHPYDDRMQLGKLKHEGLPCNVVIV